MNLDKSTVAHEIGHAVVAYDLCLPFSQISARPDGSFAGWVTVHEGLAYGDFDSENDPEILRKTITERAAIHHAGWISEMLYGGASASCLHTAKSDLGYVYEDLKRVPATEWSGIQAEAQSMATNILLENRVLYSYLNDALLQKGHLEEDELDAVMDSYFQNEIHCEDHGKPRSLCGCTPAPRMIN